MGAYIAADWGTTNRRAYLIDADGAVLDCVQDDRGVLVIDHAAFPQEVVSLRDRLGALPMIAAGMVGSTRGWVDVPYVAAPADLAALAEGRAIVPGEDVAIVPGVKLTGARSDVMRGEEVQVLGAIVAGLAPADALFCQPGTHNKWVRTVAGRIVDVSTAMTGELFALLRGNGVLKGMLDGAVADGPAFRDGIARGAGATDLTVALFEVRAAVLLGALPADDAAAFASGLLIGADVGTRDLDGRDVHLLASGPLADLYAVAIRLRGGRLTAVDNQAGFLAGIHTIWEMTR
ncbi:2-dehydro-3-deoxygalactonokinase [Sphingomonas sp. PB2P19]|uniref:2-dehydro-3-deoxygalactonokinase n=1 Tax=Sphingomonas rhamnosi TaxID=3096156 RepID=UPI002FCC27FD